MNSPLVIAGVTIGLIAVVALLWGLHRLAIYLEDQGLLYYRKGSDSGSAGGSVLMELDRLTRPSVEHVVKAQNPTVKQEKPGIRGD